MVPLGDDLQGGSNQGGKALSDIQVPSLRFRQLATTLEPSRFLSRNQKGVVVAVQVIRDEGARRERESRLRPARWAISIIGVFNNWRNV